MRNAEVFEFGGLIANSLYDFPSNEWLVIFDLSDVVTGHL